ncbi:conserved hypothetical protein [[Clostridium] ultunense Esp]|nr:conserved hypothetical protein [[Clostridium] ultunense Esp]
MKMILWFSVLGIFVNGCSVQDQGLKIKEENLITLPYIDFSWGAVVGDTLYAGVCPIHNPDTCKLIKYNLRTREEELFYESSFSASSIPTIVGNENWLVWVDSTIDGTQNKIIAQDLKTGKRKMISVHEPDSGGMKIDAPFLYKDYVTWVDIDERRIPQLILYDLKTDQKKVLATLRTYNLFNTFTFMAEDTVLWTDADEKNGYYELYDLRTGRTEEILAPRKYPESTESRVPGYAKMAGDWLISLNFTYFRDWTSHKFQMMNRHTKEVKEILPEWIIQFRVYRNLIFAIKQGQELMMFRMEKDQLKSLPVDIPQEIQQPDLILISNNKIIIEKRYAGANEIPRVVLGIQSLD